MYAEDKPNILNNAMAQFAAHNIDLTAIESKPSKFVTNSNSFFDF